MFVVCLQAPGLLWAHNISEANAQFAEGMDGPAVAPFLYLGAKHMVTGYDHLLFLVGVIFFLYKLRDVVLYVTLFTIGHRITLLLGVLGGLQVNAYLIDAIIGFSIIYRAFEDMGGFQNLLHIQPNTKPAVLVFGLIHGMGLITDILSFNVGVEIGQILALTVILLFLWRWRQSPSFGRHAFFANTLLMTGGFLLAGDQLIAYFIAVV